VPILKREPDLFPSDLFERADLDGSWWVAYARSRQEKGLARHLGEEGVAYYLPQYEKLVRRDGRRFVSFLPLFPSYVFLLGSLAERRVAVRSHLVVRFLEVLDQQRLRHELANLWLLQRSGLPLVPHAYVRPGDAVQVVDGPFKGSTGKVLREKGTLRLVVSITFLKQSVAAELDRELLEPAAPPPSWNRAAAAC
jgi:transcription antitermination factor NusG